MIISVGVDLGKVRDKSAIVITEYTPVRVQASGAWWVDTGVMPEEKKWTRSVKDTLYTVRMLQSIQLGTSYPDVGRRIAKVCRDLRTQHEAATIHLVLDQTGVGRGPVDIVKELLPTNLQIKLTAVTLTGTNWCQSAPLHRPDCSCGKAFMVVRLQSIMQKLLLQLPKGPLIAEVVEEMKRFEVRTKLNGHDTYGAFAVGTHDDLVTALGLSVLGSAHLPGVSIGPRIYV